jgi:erythromycin esterase-like protein
MAGSWEAAFREVPRDRFLLPMVTQPPWRDAVLLERAIGVIYRPDTERVSHWFHARLAQQFDAVVHMDRTTAVEPLERTSLWDRGEAPETYPTGL